MSLERVEHVWNTHGTRANLLICFVEHVEHVFLEVEYMCAHARRKPNSSESTRSNVFHFRKHKHSADYKGRRSGTGNPALAFTDRFPRERVVFKSMQQKP